jgi:coenzyme PQQ synthesis protein D (PqqD)
MIGLDSVLRRRGDVRYRVLDGEAVVLRQKAGEVLVLNEVASRLLDLADGETPLAGWVETLAAEYEVERAVLERDLVTFAGELAAAEVLEQVR